MKKRNFITPLSTMFPVAMVVLFLGQGDLCAAPGAPDTDGDGIPNIVDPDVDNDGIPIALDRIVDGGTCKSGPKRGRYVGDKLPNNSAAERDIEVECRVRPVIGRRDGRIDRRLRRVREL